MNDVNEYIDTNLVDGTLKITPEIKEYLFTTARWGKFLSIVGFVFMAIFALMGIFFGTIIANLPGSTSDAFGQSPFIGFIPYMYPLFADFYTIPIYFLYKFSTQLKKALQTDDQQSLSNSFSFLKKHYKFIGVLTAIIIGIYAFFLLIAIAFGGMGALME